MRLACRNAVLGAAALAVLLAFGGPAQAQNKCVAGKIKCVSKKKSCKLGVQAKGLTKGLAPDAAKLQKCKDKFDGGADPTKGCFAKLEAKNDGPCLSSGDTAALEAKVDSFVTDVVTELSPGFPTPVLNKCASGKVKCVSKKDKCILNVQATGKKKGLPPDPAKLQKCKDKFDGGADPTKGCFAKLEAKPDPCLTTADSAALEAKADAFDLDVVTELSTGPAAACPTEIQFTGTSTTGVLDTGWTGLGHDATVISKGTVTVTVTGCTGTAPTCDVCSYTGPIENHAGQLHARRCQGDSAIQCTTDAGCPGTAPCKFFFGSYLPLSAGGVSTCVGNAFAGGISGTANLDSSGVGAGTSEGLASVTSRVFSGPTLAGPCPKCVGDATANDGVKGGTCDSGLHTGPTALCDISGTSPNIEWGSTSLDCPPATGGLIATLPINLNNTTGAKTRTLSAANPPCSAAVGKSCQCDTCANTAATPCSSNADCPATIVCGGPRCISGVNGGAQCSAPSVCPGSSCGAPGEQTKPNKCSVANDCTADPGTPSPNDRNCPNGPFDTFCSPVETFVGCAVNSQCTFPGDTCIGGKFRDCFDNGTIGEVVTATGQADPPTAHAADPTLAAMFCIGPTTAPAVNTAAGLPGLGRLELQGHSTDNGTP